MPTSYPATQAVSSWAPLAPMACATATAGGNTTVAGWNTEPLCTSSCSATCEAAALAMAARYGLVHARLMITSDGPAAGVSQPGTACGPMASAKRVMLSTGREPWPATAEPNQSTSRSSVLRTTDAGMASKRSWAAKAASWVAAEVISGLY